MEQLMTRWGENLDTENVHLEYPRPQMVRDSYYNLNGSWDYAIRANDRVDCYDGKILVPYSPETRLSGVERIVKPSDYLHYRKNFILPKEFEGDKKILLHFGAVDQECEVYLNGTRIGEHKGGYLPFTFDVTRSVQQENTLILVVHDYTELSPHARGKQRLKRTGHMSSIFYTPSSGIWKSVWMEAVPNQYISNVKITTDLDHKSVEILVQIDGEPWKSISNSSGREKKLNIEIYKLGKKIAVSNLEITDITRKTKGSELEHTLYRMSAILDEVHPWSPEHPDLYDVKITYEEDLITTYFAMRKFHRAKDSSGIWRFYLNNEPIFFHGVLDQGYWPESLLTPPTDEALQDDIKKLKEYGFNTIRKHIKVESDRFYYHCDRLGMIVWQDMPNGGGEYNMGFVTYLPNGLPWFGRVVSDHHYGLFKRRDSEGRAQYRKDLKEMVELLYNHPSIAVWTPFNEGWGQFDACKATALIRSVDSTRLVNEACGWFDQGGGDMYSIHNYMRKLVVRPNTKRVVALTEFGGYAYPIPGHMACEKEFGYKGYQSKAELSEAYCKLYETEIYPNIANGLSSAIYTQTSDIEEEINGFLTYDRKVEKFDIEMVQEINRKLQEIFHEVVK